MVSAAIHGRVLVASLDRPPHNALDAAMADAIDDALDQAISADMAVLHLRSDAGGFCGGAHPDRLAAWLDEAAGADALVADGRQWHALFCRIETAPLVVLAEISGMALGAGLGLALACDLRIAGEDAKLGVPEARFGLLPAGQTMARINGSPGSRWRAVCCSPATPSTPSEALGLGLVDWIAPTSRAGAQATAIARASPACRRSPCARRRQSSELHRPIRAIGKRRRFVRCWLLPRIAAAGRTGRES